MVNKIPEIIVMELTVIVFLYSELFNRLKVHLGLNGANRVNNRSISLIKSKSDQDVFLIASVYLKSRN